MLRVYLWGAGRNLKYVYDSLNLAMVKLAGIIDSNPFAQSSFHGVAVERPNVLQSALFDFVVITAKNDQSIRAMYHSLGLPMEKIISFFGREEDLPIRLFNADKVARWKAEFAAYKWEMRARNAPYEYGKEEVHILGADALLEHIEKERCSLSRFGDGEFSLILGEERPWFQKTDPALAKSLKNVLAIRDRDLCIAIADNYGSLAKYTETAADGIRAYQCEKNHRAKILGLLETGRIYGDAYVTRPYIIYRDHGYSERVFSLWKHIFEKRNLLIVEGASSRFGAGNDLLHGASSIRRIWASPQDAFKSYGDIVKSVFRNAHPDDLVLASLGPTATVLAADLAEQGIQTIDIGQLDNEYDWYRMGANERTSIPGKMTAEVFRGHVEGNLKEDVSSQVVARVLT